jgi:hypothetical protein
MQGIGTMAQRPEENTNLFGFLRAFVPSCSVGTS